MPTRRDLLAGCGAVAGAGVLAGCSGLPFVGGGGGESGDDSYVDWLPARSGGFARFGSLEPAALAGRDGVPDRLVEDSVLGVAAADLDRYAFFEHERASTTVLRSPLSADDLRDRLLDSDRITGMQAVEAYADYERYDVEASEYDLALRDGTVVIGPQAVLEAVIDVREGSGERLTGANDAAGLLADELTDADRVTGRVRLASDATGPLLPESVLASGTSVSVGAEQTEQTRAVVFRSSDATDEEGVRQSVASGANVTVSSAATSDRVVTVRSTIPTASL